jgi:hypothetical protein
MEKAHSILDALPTELAPLAAVARGLLDKPGDLAEDGVLRLGHRPWVAPENYAITLYPGLPADSLHRYARQFVLEVPETYASVLAATNGAYCFGMALVGVPRSMLGSPPLLDRSRLQCQDMGMLARSAVYEYRKLPPGAFHFGWRHFSYRENIGYFLADGRIMSIRKSGKVVDNWNGVAPFLQAELAASAALDAELHPIKSAH